MCLLVVTTISWNFKIYRSKKTKLAGVVQPVGRDVGIGILAYVSKC